MKTLPPHSTALLTCCNFVNLSVSISVIRKIRRKVHTAGPRGWEWWIMVDTAIISRSDGQEDR